MLEYEFPWAKRYSPKARTFAGGKQFLNRVFRLSNLVPKIWSIVSKAFLVTLNCCRKYFQLLLAFGKLMKPEARVFEIKSPTKKFSLNYHLNKFSQILRDNF